ncbi:MAG: MTH865 family protein [Methanosarcinales archaeon]|nr:MTH865 family protein [Methanosarcinales archaeon]
MNIRDEIHSQIVMGLAGAQFPIKSPQDLLAGFPDGANTTCKAGDLEVTAGEAGKLLKASDFPFNNAKDIADVIVERAGL